MDSDRTAEKAVAPDGAVGDTEDKRTGDTSQRCDKAPVSLFSEHFSPEAEPPKVLDLKGLIRELADIGFRDADTPAGRFLLQRVGREHLDPYLKKAIENTGAAPYSLRFAHALLRFDRMVEATMLEYIGIVEQQLRTQWATAMAEKGGAFAHLEGRLFKKPKKPGKGYDDALASYFREERRRLAGDRGLAAEHDRYGALPVWKAVELMSLGTLSKLYANTRPPEVRNAVASSFGVDSSVLVGWVRALTVVRNLSAHFSPFCTQGLIVAPARIRGLHYKENQHPFYAALILERLLQADDSSFAEPTLAYSAAFFQDMANIINMAYEEARAFGFPSDPVAIMADRHVFGGDGLDVQTTPGVAVGIGVRFTGEGGPTSTMVPGRCGTIRSAPLYRPGSGLGN